MNKLSNKEANRIIEIAKGNGIEPIIIGGDGELFPETCASSHLSPANIAIDIIALHDKILQAVKLSLEDAFRIGELLTKCKKQKKHGEFVRWIDLHLPFSARTAQNYMKLHKHEEKIKYERVSFLDGAYKLLDKVKKSSSETDEYGDDSNESESDEDNPNNNINIDRFKEMVREDHHKDYLVVDERKEIIHVIHKDECDPLDDSSIRSAAINREKYQSSLIGDDGRRKYYRLWQESDTDDELFDLDENDPGVLTRQLCESAGIKEKRDKTLKDHLIDVMFCDYPLELEVIVDRLYRLKGYSMEEKHVGLLKGFMISSKDFDGDDKEFTCHLSPSGQDITQKTWL